MNVRRNIKNVFFNYSEAARKVREATSNDPADPSIEIMQELADMTFDIVVFADIMPPIFKRLRDTGKNWRHVYKSLILLDYLVRNGCVRITQQCKEAIFTIQALREFKYIEGGVDQGAKVRERAKQLVTLLKDDERLKNERAKAEAIRQRLLAAGVLGRKERQHGYYGRTGYYSTSFPAYDGITFPSERELHPHIAQAYAAPANYEEETTQLQIALSLSRKQAMDEGIPVCPEYHMFAPFNAERRMTNELGKNVSESNLVEYYAKEQERKTELAEQDRRARCNSANPWVNEPLVSKDEGQRVADNPWGSADNGGELISMDFKTNGSDEGPLTVGSWETGGHPLPKAAFS